MTETAGLSATLEADPPVPVPKRRPVLGRGLAVVLGLTAYLAAWIPFVVSAIRSVQHNSPLIADGAATALRSWDVLAPYGPLVGQATMLRNGAFDPGPLQYWLLVIPVHMDPVNGVVWGSALWCAVAATIAIAATRSVLGPFGGLAASALILGLVAWQPLVAAQPYWNPWFGALFFLATLAAGLAVMSGRRRWWPMMVITGSVAAQSHLMYALATGAVVVLALLVGLVSTIRAKRGYLWAAFGLLLGAACWAAPFIQQFTSPYGNNLSALTSSLGADQTAGSTFAWKALGATAQPPPLWWTPSLRFHYYGMAREIIGRSSGWGVAVVAATAAALVLAIFLLRSRRAAALSAISLIISVGLLVTNSNIPVENLNLRAQNYLLIDAYPVGVLAWLSVGSVVVLILWRAIRLAWGVPARLRAAGGPSAWLRGLPGQLRAAGRRAARRLVARLRAVVGLPARLLAAGRRAIRRLVAWLRAVVGLPARLLAAGRRAARRLTRLLVAPVLAVLRSVRRGEPGGAGGTARVTSSVGETVLARADAVLGLSSAGETVMASGSETAMTPGSTGETAMASGGNGATAMTPGSKGADMTAGSNSETAMTAGSAGGTAMTAGSNSETVTGGSAGGTTAGEAAGETPVAAGRGRGPVARWAVRAAGLAAVALAGAGSWLATVQLAYASAIATPNPVVIATRTAAAAIEQVVPRERFYLLAETSSRIPQRDLTMGLVWALHHDGYWPMVNHRTARFLGWHYLYRGRPLPEVTVVVRREYTSVQVLVSPNPADWLLRR
jgi:hypothetical protein